ncbi:hypothetical protein [Frankia sp. AgB32]|uniref:hypothetical protein n=1 Tax=Frankia sp. AgB32 TaxID=631119 RepID=UPI00200DC96E|nr:hypothetical protein [Frankia sp. AgB32]MCK9896808.1 hypothetical protein [Frankia sp. AgB32]
MDEESNAIVPMLSLVACNRCRRRRGAQLHATGTVESVPRHGTCPHGRPLRTLWAPGYGPDAEPPVDPTTPEERRRGAV